MAFYVRTAAVWLLILLLAILNGAFREMVLYAWLGNPASQLVSGALLIAAIVLVAWLLVPRLRPSSRGDLWRAGVLWVALTLAFEFGFGLLVQGKALRELLDAYTFEGGNIWPLVLLATLLAPRLAGHRLGNRATTR